MTLFEKSTSMQIIPFPAHYQLVFHNFDFSSFSRISCKPKIGCFELQKLLFFKSYTEILLMQILSTANSHGCCRVLHHRRNVDK